LGKTWPAIDASGDADLVLAAADDYAPTAVEERDASLRIFFATTDIRDRAAVALASRFAVTSVDVEDDDWARRSQENLASITVGRVTVEPRVPSPEPRPAAGHHSQITIVIPPSMGFGTGHHATTRLCLSALQTIDLGGAFVLDVGTGSGVLAIAAVKLGAARALGIDDDADAIQAANENLGFNNLTGGVEFVVGDLMSLRLPPADVVTANLTGALVVRAAQRLVDAVRPGGVLIVSGVLDAERDDIHRAFANQTFVTDVQEDEWRGFTIRSS
jgi:ribosomal protein L11 methyltransferase